jgi:hypothetical protein
MRAYLFFSFLVVGILGSCVGNQQLNCLNSELIIPSDQIEALRLRAIKGDAEASYSLYSHFRFGLFNSSLALKWLIMAYEQGSPKAAHALLVGYKITSTHGLNRVEARLGDYFIPNESRFETADKAGLSRVGIIRRK